MSKYLATRLGATLRVLRLRRHLTLTALAGDRLSPATVSRIEHGTLLPSLDTLEQLAAALGVPIAHLLAPQADDGQVGAVVAVEAWLLLGQPLQALEQGRRVLAGGGVGLADEEQRLRWAVVRAAALLDDAQLPEAMKLVEVARRAGSVWDAARLAVAGAAALEIVERVALLQEALNRVGQATEDVPQERVVRVELLVQLARDHEQLGAIETARGLLVEAQELAAALAPSVLASRLLADGRAVGSDADVPVVLWLAAIVASQRLLNQCFAALARLDLQTGRVTDAARRIQRALDPSQGSADLKELWAELLRLQREWRGSAESAPVQEEVVDLPEGAELAWGRFELALTAKDLETAERWAGLIAAADAVLAPQVWQRLALAWAEAGDPRRAAAALRRLG
ncbi:MAG: helix-turn-helix domain-containing protein [Chloroflexi bacterium]|nr:helix-turn-helix domain-containing protein [Chloroflexota bacterium]